MENTCHLKISVNKPEIFSIRSVDSKASLYLKLFSNGDEKNVILILHGLGQYHEDLLMLKNLKEFNGAAVAFADLRGHGLSSGKRFDIESFDSYLDDLEVLIKQIKEILPDRKVIVFGHCLGGLIALEYLLNSFEKDIDGVVLSDPLLEIQTKASGLTGLLTQKTKTLIGDIPIILPKTSSRNDPLSKNIMSLRLLNEIQGSFRRIRHNAYYVDCPLLLLKSASPVLSSERQIEQFYRSIPRGKKTLHEYDKPSQLLYNTKGENSFGKDIGKWLNFYFSS
jgi:alpha-beta hydrolase superfamily lysophospholipase